MREFEGRRAEEEQKRERDVGEYISCDIMNVM
jgi:hypothetical protein